MDKINRRNNYIIYKFLNLVFFLLIFLEINWKLRVKQVFQIIYKSKNFILKDLLFICNPTFCSTYWSNISHKIHKFRYSTSIRYFLKNLWELLNFKSNKKKGSQKINLSYKIFLNINKIIFQKNLKQSK